MNDYIIFMHDDTATPMDSATSAWQDYFAMLRASGRFCGGSSIGPGICVHRSGQARPVTPHLSGYLHVQAESIDDAKKLLLGNPVLNAGGTVEIRELPRD
ncbi:hypothetical protein [Janthinobacterium sp. DSP2-3-3]|uniref:hypothetical protein n=1 Tax=Janthinobacterium sp. DSP2-3-3 TaxID=2804596 RepID=UPI003CEEBA8C